MHFFAVKKILDALHITFVTSPQAEMESNFAVLNACMVGFAGDYNAMHVPFGV